MSKSMVTLDNRTYVIPNIAGWSIVEKRDEVWHGLGAVPPPSYPIVYIYLGGNKPIMETFKTNEEAREFAGLLEDCVTEYWEGSTNAE